jgi:hypothetical protein
MQQYDPNVAEMVLELVSSGFTLEQIENIDGMPRRVDFLRWRRKNATLNAEYQQAIADRVALSFDRLSVCVNDLLNKENEFTGKQLAQYKLAMDTLCKMLNKIAPPTMSGEGPEEFSPDVVPHVQISFVKSAEDDPRVSS